MRCLHGNLTGADSAKQGLFMLSNSVELIAAELKGGTVIVHCVFLLVLLLFSKRTLFCYCY